MAALECLDMVCSLSSLLPALTAHKKHLHFTQNINYRPFVVFLLPRLGHLDITPITRDEWTGLFFVKMVNPILAKMGSNARTTCCSQFTGFTSTKVQILTLMRLPLFLHSYTHICIRAQRDTRLHTHVDMSVRSRMYACVYIL